MAEYTIEEINKLIEDAQSPYGSAIVDDAITGAGLGAIAGGVPLSMALLHSQMTPSNCYGFTTPGAVVSSLGVGGVVGGSAGGVLGGAVGGLTGAIRNLIRRNIANRKLEQLIESGRAKTAEATGPLADAEAPMADMSYAELAELKRRANKSYLRTRAGDALVGAALGGASMGVPAGLYSTWLQNDTYADAWDKVVLERDKDGNPTKRGKLPNAAYPIMMDTGFATGMGTGIGLTGGAIYGLIDTILERRKAKAQLAEYETKKKTAEYNPYNVNPYLINGGTGALTGALLGMLYNKVLGKKLLDKQGLLTGLAAGTMGGLTIGYRHKQRQDDVAHGKRLFNKYTYINKDGKRVVAPGQYIFYSAMAPDVVGGTMGEGMLYHGDNVAINTKGKPFSVKYTGSDGTEQTEDAVECDDGTFALGINRAGDPAHLDQCYLSVMNPNGLINRYLHAYDDEAGGRKFNPGKNPGYLIRAHRIYSGGDYDEADSPSAQLVKTIFNRAAPYLKLKGQDKPSKYLTEYGVVPNMRTGERNCITDALALSHGLPQVDYDDVYYAPLGAPSQRQLNKYYKDITAPAVSKTRNIFDKGQDVIIGLAQTLGII